VFKEKKKDIVNYIDISKEMKEIDGWNKNERNGYTFIDLFAGAGGLSCGMVMAGFTPIASVEIMKEAVMTYRYNFIDNMKFNEFVETRDIREKSVKDNLYKFVKDKSVDVIVGGFPCQGFSMAGNRIIDDPRNSLYLEMLEIVDKIKPKFLIMENVEGLRSMLGGKVEEKIIEDYKEIGYKINVTILNSADYGVPQLRKRVIFIGNRIGYTNYHPKPILSPNEYKTLGEAIEKYMDIPENKEINHIFTKHNDEMIKKIIDIPEGKSLYGNYSDAWKKSPWDKPSCTIKENHGGVNLHPKLGRVLTPRELASLQSFPEDFIFMGSKKWQLVQIGNAVPPLMAKAIGLSVFKSLKKGDNEMKYYEKIKIAQEKITEYTTQIFKVYGNELLLRLEEYNLLKDENNCLESSTAIGFIIEEFLVSKLRIYTEEHKGDELIIDKSARKTVNSSYDCFSNYKDIFIMINVKVEKSENNAVASINKLYKDYVEKDPEIEKAYLILKIKYDYGISIKDNQRKIFIEGLDSYYLEEFDFSKGHSQDYRNWSKDFKPESGRLQLKPNDQKLNKDEISYNRTKKFIKDIFDKK
jgi:DNA (cytosine-5-)-methyltransferase